MTRRIALCQAARPTYSRSVTSPESSSLSSDPRPLADRLAAASKRLGDLAEDAEDDDRWGELNDFERCCLACVVQYEDGLKIDFSLWPVELLQQIAADPRLPDELDAGYQVLLDKDQLTQGLKPPTYSAYIPQPPTEAQYQETLENFFLDATYVAKLLWRDDVMAAKHLLDELMKQEHLRPMLEWRIELEHQWSVKPGPYGRRLKQWLPPALWSELERTYTGAELEANWAALFATLALMRRVAQEVGERLGYHYPDGLEWRVAAYLQRVRQLARGAVSFG